MKKICAALIFSLFAGAASADDDWQQMEDWQVSSIPEGCMAWTVAKDGPNAQLQIRHLADGTWDIGFRGAKWFEDFGGPTASNPFRDRSGPTAEITIGAVGSEETMRARVSFLGRDTVAQHADLASYVGIDSELFLANAKGADVEIKTNGEPVAVFSTKGYVEAKIAYKNCEAGLPG